MIRIIDNKRIDLSEDEHRMYTAICNGYTQGADLFKDLFETDHEGLIVFLKPPQKHFSMEVIVFLQNVTLHQHIRKMYREHQIAIKQLMDLKEELLKLKEVP